MTRKPAIRMIAVGLAALTLVFVPAGLAGKPGAGTSGCTANAPAVAVDNTWAWATWGSWGLPGQQLGYAVNVINNDVGCGSSSFVVSVSAPSGFSVSMPTSTVSLKSSSSAYVWAYATSPSGAADGNYPLTFTVRRAGGSDPTSGSFTSYYKVYSSDTEAPTLFWQNPGDGTTIGGRSYGVTVASRDDHAVRKIDLYLDSAYVSTTVCDGVSYICQLYYKWSLRGVRGQHTATFKATDWKDNVADLTVTFDVT